MLASMPDGATPMDCAGVGLLAQADSPMVASKTANSAGTDPTAEPLLRGRIVEPRTHHSSSGGGRLSPADFGRPTRYVPTRVRSGHGVRVMSWVVAPLTLTAVALAMLEPPNHWSG